MNIFTKIKSTLQRQKTSQQQEGKPKKISENTQNSLSDNSDFIIFDSENKVGETYYQNAWVNIAINILIRNIARADFTIKLEGEDVNSGAIYELFRCPNKSVSRYDLWKETAAWWLLEGEAFWWFGEDYSGGLPKEIYILNPRQMRHEGEFAGNVDFTYKNKVRRWFYQTQTELIPILADEIIHFREWNPFNPVRGVNPLISLSLELEQDYFANKANSTLLKNNAIPQGILKTEQT